MRLSTARLLLALAALLAGCNSATSPVCPDTAPKPRISERERTLQLGATYAARAEALICAGTRTTQFTGVWRSANAAVATIDSTTGLVRAQGKGSTYVYAHHVTSGIPRSYGQYDSLLIRVP